MELKGLDVVEIEHRLTRLEVMCEDIPKISSTLDEINTKFAKYEGKWGTFALIGAAVWAGLLAFKDDIMGWFK